MTHVNGKNVNVKNRINTATFQQLFPMNEINATDVISFFLPIKGNRNERRCHFPSDVVAIIDDTNVK
jgi:glutaredoxin-related protein